MPDQVRHDRQQFSAFMNLDTVSYERGNLNLDAQFIHIYRNMKAEDIKISLGLPSSAVAEVTAFYFDIFPRKLGLVLGRRKGVKMIADHLNKDQIFVARAGDTIVGIAGFKYDGVGLFELDKQAFLECYGPLIGRARAALWASVQTVPRPNQLLLEGLGVLPHRRSSGIGTMLLKAVDQRAMELGKTEVILEVTDTNSRAKALYERFGYRTVVTKRNLMFRLAGFSAAHLMLHKLNKDSKP
jgi:ribosomal protein S18 acetylase RimI-like enzyme